MESSSMRVTAQIVSGATVGVAVALVWYFRPQPESSLAPDAPELPAPAEDIAVPRVDELSPAEAAPEASAAPGNESAVAAAPAPPRSPLPGETPTTPMTQMLADRQHNVIVRDDPAAGRFPPGLAEGEREFAAEPIDATWAPGAEADLLAKIAQMPGLKLIDLQVQCRSTMCQLQLTQPPATPRQEGLTPFTILNDEIDLTPRR
jgi:hypothetical protein